MLAPWEKSHDKTGQHIKKQRHCFADKGQYSQSYVLSSSHVQMWDWTIKKARHQRLDAFELWCWRRVSRVPWTARRSDQSILNEINPEYPDAEALVLWPPDARSWLIGKDSDAGKDWRQEDKGSAEDEMVRSHHQLSRHEFELIQGDSGGQRSLVCYSPWFCKEVDMA